MPTNIFRDEIRPLVEQGAQLVEVLLTKEYAEAHLPKAINIPLKMLDQQAAQQLRLDRPVIVYCNDYTWDLSARAAWRLESLGFGQVFRYVPGKADWFASGLPRAGAQASVPQAGDRARRDVPTCHLTDLVGAARSHAEAAGWDVCAVVNDQRVVLGLLYKAALDSDPQAPVAAVMEAGPTS
jgi:rhodanese-related sulfurtransferase